MRRIPVFFFFFNRTTNAFDVIVVHRSTLTLWINVLLVKSLSPPIVSSNSSSSRPSSSYLQETWAMQLLSSERLKLQQQPLKM